MTTQDNVAIIAHAYDAFACGDLDTVLGTLDPEVRWTECAGDPHAGTYVGPDAVLVGVFAPVDDDWNGWQTVPERFVADGDTVVAVGTYSATARATGRQMQARFVHVFELRAGRVVRYEQIADTATIVAPLG